MITVIIPVYNAEKYLKRTIKSVINQNYEEWEIIAVNDGSTDNSLNILQEFSELDSRIHIISKENSGAGAARNEGLKYAKGEYVVFLDSDDYISKEYFSLLSKKNEDVVFVDVMRKNEDSSKYSIEKMSKYRNYCKEDIIRFQMTGEMPWGGCRKAVKRNLILNNKILYSEHQVGEEAIYSFEILNKAENIGFIDKPLYCYNVHDGSLSRTILEDPWGDVSLALKDKVKQQDLYNKYSSTINSFIIVAGIVSLINMAKLYSWKEYVIHAKRKIKWIKENLDVTTEIDFKHMNKKARILYPFVKIQILYPIYLLGRMR